MIRSSLVSLGSAGVGYACGNITLGEPPKTTCVDNSLTVWAPCATNDVQTACKPPHHNETMPNYTIGASLTSTSSGNTSDTRSKASWVRIGLLQSFSMTSAVLVTGASKGFGQALALAFAKRMTAPSKFVRESRVIKGFFLTNLRCILCRC